jgi:Bacterial oxidoreductases, C-terminal
MYTAISIADLSNGRDEPIDVSAVDVSMNGIELQDREFVAAIREKREPNASVHQVLPCYRVLHELEGMLACFLGATRDPVIPASCRYQLSAPRENAPYRSSYVRMLRQHAQAGTPRSSLLRPIAC